MSYDRIVILILFYLGVCVACCSAQTLSVKLVDTKGRPIAGVSVMVKPAYDKTEPKPRGAGQITTITTDEHGQVDFRLPQPPPDKVWVKAMVDDSRWQCGCLYWVKPSDLAHSGIVDDGVSNKRGASITARPGEIVFVVRPLSIWERLLYPLVKE